MDIILRSDARKRNLGKYYTGVPCKNNHLAQRYTLSGSCEECIKTAITVSRSTVIEGEVVNDLPKSLSISQQKIELANRKLAIKEQELTFKLANKHESNKLKEIKRVIKEDLREFFFETRPRDYDNVLTMIWTACVMRNPIIRREDVASGRKPPAHGFYFYCYPLDRPGLLKITWELMNKTSNLEAKERGEENWAVKEAKKIADNIEAQYQKEIDEQPHFDPRRPM